MTGGYRPKSTPGVSPDTPMPSTMREHIKEEHDKRQDRLIVESRTVSELEHSEETLRDMFAMAVVSGLCANPKFKGDSYYYSTKAYMLADAMMKARKETKE